MLIQWRASSHRVVFRSSPARGADVFRRTGAGLPFGRVALGLFDFGKGYTIIPDLLKFASDPGSRGHAAASSG
jgi:hypothetical protein